MSAVESGVQPGASAAEMQRRLDLADGALGAAGHEVTDPKLRELGRQVASGEISADEAIARGMKRIDAM